MSITLRDEIEIEIEIAINRNCAENGSNTPRFFILAEYLIDCLAAYDTWWG